jgi:hypothetical protein
MLNHLGKKIAVATLLLATAFTTLACNAKTKNLAPNGAELPVLTTPDAVFFQGADFSITYQQIYEQFKANDGINQLLFMVDSHLFATELAAVSQADIDAKIKFLQYGTDDDALIAELSDEDKASLEENYAQNIFLLGYQNDAAVYARMLVAKENIALAAMLNPVNKDLTWYLSDTVIKNDYVNNYFEDVAAIKIRFFSETDAKTAMRSLNLVSYQGDLRLYTGTKPIEEVSSNGFNDTNTRVLTEAEVLLYYIRLYNYAYAGWKPLLPEATTVAELIANEEFTFAHKDIKAIQSGLATYLFTSLNSREAFLADTNSNLYYSYQPMRYAGSADTAHYMILKLTGTPKVDLSTFTATQTNLNQLIGQELYDELKEKSSIRISKRADSSPNGFPKRAPPPDWSFTITIWASTIKASRPRMNWTPKVRKPWLHRSPTDLPSAPINSLPLRFKRTPLCIPYTPPNCRPSWPRISRMSTARTKPRIASLIWKTTNWIRSPST